MTSENVAKQDPVESAVAVSAKAVDDQLIDELVSGVQAEGLQLTGEGGLLQQLTKRLLESALEGEITEHLGYDQHDPVGEDGDNSRNGKRSRTVLTEVGPVEIAVPLTGTARSNRDRQKAAEAPDRLPGAINPILSGEPGQRDALDGDALLEVRAVPVPVRPFHPHGRRTRQTPHSAPTRADTNGPCSRLCCAAWPPLPSPSRPSPSQRLPRQRRPFP
ncbi:hypothetical protein GCM10010451_38130 [Streptomyces virens]|uniref:Mutator family transposase n=1 Tax=Streptomyces virens TaxID=285572 RepID=A0ABP6PPH2_9ACTN|nr:hypothetical protein [Streptomyces calvus]